MREMKDSNAELLGKIPKHWTVCKLKYIMNNYDNLRKPVDAGKRCQTGDVLYNYYGASGVIDSINGFTHSGKYLLIGEDGANLVLRHLPVVYIAEGKFWVNNHAHVLSTKKDFSLSFFAYQMEVIDYYNYITGSAQPKLSQFNLNLVKLIVPPTSEQHRIADFLDQKCTEIDALTADIQTQIETLEEYKKSVITEAVTKGLDPNVELKDSGVEWVGKIPKDWGVIPVKFCFSITNGSDPKSDEGDTPVYGSGKGHFKTCKEFKKGPTVLLGRKGTVNIPQWIEGNYWNVDTAFGLEAKRDILHDIHEDRCRMEAVTRYNAMLTYNPENGITLEEEKQHKNGKRATGVYSSAALNP